MVLDFENWCMILVKCFNSLFTGMVRVGMKIPQDGNRANVHNRVAVVHGHVWRTVCSVCATGARVAHPVPCRNLSFLRFHRRRHPVVSSCCFTWKVRVGVKIPHDGNRTKVYGHVAMVHVHVWRTVFSACDFCNSGTT